MSKVLSPQKLIDTLGNPVTCQQREHSFGNMEYIFSIRICLIHQQIYQLSAPTKCRVSHNKVTPQHGVSLNNVKCYTFKTLPSSYSYFSQPWCGVTLRQEQLNVQLTMVSTLWNSYEMWWPNFRSWAPVQHTFIIQCYTPHVLLFSKQHVFDTHTLALTHACTCTHTVIERFLTACIFQSVMFYWHPVWAA